MVVEKISSDEAVSRELECLRARVAELEKSEQRFRTTLYGIADGMIATDVECRVLQMNAVAEQLTGWSEAEARGQHIEEVFSIISEQTGDRVENTVSRVIEDKTTVGLAGHTLLVSKEGIERPIADSGSPIYDNDGVITGAVLIFRDQTKEHRAQQRESHLKRVLLAIRNVNHLITHEKNPDRLLNEACRLLTVSRGFYNAWITLVTDKKPIKPYYSSGFNGNFEPMAEQLQQQKLPMCAKAAIESPGIHVIGDPISECGDCPLATGYQGRAAFTIQLAHEKKDYGWLTVSLPKDMAADKEEQSLFKEMAGDIAYALWSLENEAALEESEHRFRSLFDNNHTVMLMIDPVDGTIIDGNPAAAKFYGWSRDQLRQLTIHDINTLTKAEVEQEIRAAKGSRRSCFRFRHRLASQEEREVDVYSGPIRIGEKKLLYSIIHDVSTHHEAERALRLSEYKMSSIFRAAPIGIGVVINRKLTELNDRFCEIIGYSRSELIGKSSRILYLSDEDYEHVGREKYKMIKERGTGTVETRFMRKDGSIRDILMSSTPLDPEDLLAGVTFTALDITERKEALRALRESEQRLQIAGQAAYDLIYEWDVASDALEWFGDVDSMLGYSEGEISRCIQGWFDHIHPEDRKALMDVLEYHRSASEPLQHDYRVKHKNGTYRYWRNNGLPLIDENGELRKWVGVCTDITESKQAEAALHTKQLEIDAIYMNAPLFMLLLDIEGRVRRMNDPALKMINRVQDEIVGLHGGEALGCFRRFDDERGCGYGELCKNCTIRTAVRATFQTGKSIQGLEATFPQQRGSEIFNLWVLVSTVFLKLPGEKMVLVCMQDITDLKDSEQQRVRLELQFQQAQKIESIGRLAGGVAHDLNNLLTPILGYGELLMEDISADDPRRGHSEQIVKAGLRARDLVGQLLAFSSKQTLEFKSIDLNALLHNFEKLLRRTIREDVNLRYDPMVGGAYINGDAGQIEQVVMNLVINAQDAMPQGGDLTISTSRIDITDDSHHVHGVVDGDYVVLGVIDTGCGMDAGTREQIFEPFFTTRTRDKGTGLGLATVYGIVKQHGGYIRVLSAPGEGAKFLVYLPVSSKQDRVDEQSQQRQTDRGGSETLLLVEDDQQVKHLAVNVLRRKGYTVLVAQSGKEALEVLESHNASLDLLVTDVIMPEMNGKQLYEEVSRVSAGVRVLYMSGYPDEVIAHRGVMEAGVHFIQKPFSINGLSAKVREVLDQ